MQPIRLPVASMGIHTAQGHFASPEAYRKVQIEQTEAEITRAERLAMCDYQIAKSRGGTPGVSDLLLRDCYEAQVDYMTFHLRRHLEELKKFVPQDQNEMRTEQLMYVSERLAEVEGKMQAVETLKQSITAYGYPKEVKEAFEIAINQMLNIEQVNREHEELKATQVELEQAIMEGMKDSAHADTKHT